MTRNWIDKFKRNLHFDFYLPRQTSEECTKCCSLPTLGSRQCVLAMLGFFRWFLCYVENYAAHHRQHTFCLSLSVSFPSMSFHSFSPSDQKFATGSDDGTVRIWDFYRCYEEKVLRGKERFYALFSKYTLLCGSAYLTIFLSCLKTDLGESFWNLWKEIISLGYTFLI